MTMNDQPILLPPLTDGSRPELEPGGHIVIVGANGTGKSRFTMSLAADLKGEAYTMSCLNAIYVEDEASADSPSPIDRRYADSLADGMPGERRCTQLQRVMTLLMRDEMLNLIGYKLRMAGDPDAALEHTRLDDVIQLWQDIFPDNKVLIESGKMLFSQRHSSDDSYSATRLSAGERAVIYYLGAVSYAPEGAYVFVDSPEMFLHPTMIQSVWNRIELFRPDCTFVYTTHDLDFASSRSDARVIWVRGYDAHDRTWDYNILPPGTPMSEELYTVILGARKPVLFIEGDAQRSIDAKLYPLIFPDYTVRPLGSCNKVIESTRTFNDLKAFHQLDSYGIVDRDRRDEHEVEYLRRKKVMVPEVAEVENILMLEPVIRAVAEYRGRNADKVFGKVRQAIVNQFRHEYRSQALQHTRHRVKRITEYRIDGRFGSIGMLEKHIMSLVDEINPRGLYEQFCKDFSRYADEGDYASILRVYNQKSMLPSSNVAALCGLADKDDYIDTILDILRGQTSYAAEIRLAVRRCFNLEKPADEPAAVRKNPSHHKKHSRR